MRLKFSLFLSRKRQNKKNSSKNEKFKCGKSSSEYFVSRSVRDDCSDRDLRELIGDMRQRLNIIIGDRI